MSEDMINKSFDQGGASTPLSARKRGAPSEVVQ
jgi:hypothetical protein